MAEFSDEQMILPSRANLEDERYESVYTELPLIGKIPKHIKGHILETKKGQINLRTQNRNFFRRMEWFEGRKMRVETAICIKDTCIGAYPIKKGEVCPVFSMETKYNYGVGRYCSELHIRRHSIVPGDKETSVRPYSAHCFLPTIYKIYQDVTD